MLWQDFTQAELRLLIHLATDKNDLMLAGDSAQTIASGVSFRSVSLSRSLALYFALSLEASYPCLDQIVRDVSDVSFRALLLTRSPFFSVCLSLSVFFFSLSWFLSLCLSLLPPESGWQEVSSLSLSRSLSLSHSRSLSLSPSLSSRPPESALTCWRATLLRPLPQVFRSSFLPPLQYCTHTLRSGGPHG